MNVTELRSALHQHVDDLQDLGMHERVEAARRRGTTIRRRRRAVAAGAIAMSLPLAASVLLAVNPIGGGGAPSVDQPGQDVLRASFAGRTLIDSTMASGAGELDLTVRTDGASQWAATCFGVGDAYTLHQSIDGWEGQSPCLNNAPSDPPWGPRLDQGSAELPGTHTMRIWITGTSDGQPAAPVDAVLAVGAYRLPDKAAVVSGAPVYDLEESEGVSWKLAHTAQSERGARTFTTSYDSGDQPVFIEVLTAGSADTPVTVRVDRALQTVGPGRLGADSCWLGSFPAGSHTVRLTVRDGAPADAVLGVVWRTPAD